MKDALLRLYIRARVLREDSGQDLVEYALVVALISLAAVGGMKTLAGGINTALARWAARWGLTLLNARRSTVRSQHGAFCGSGIPAMCALSSRMCSGRKGS